MRRWLIHAASAAAAWVAVASAMAAQAETCSLQIKRLEAASGRTTGPPADTMFRGVYPSTSTCRRGSTLLLFPPEAVRPSSPR